MSVEVSFNALSSKNFYNFGIQTLNTQFFYKKQRSMSSTPVSYCSENLNTHCF